MRNGSPYYPGPYLPTTAAGQTGSTIIPQSAGSAASMAQLQNSSPSIVALSGPNTVGGGANATNDLLAQAASAQNSHLHHQQQQHMSHILGGMSVSSSNPAVGPGGAGLAAAMTSSPLGANSQLQALGYDLNSLAQAQYSQQQQQNQGYTPSGISGNSAGIGASQLAQSPYHMMAAASPLNGVISGIGAPGLGGGHQGGGQQASSPPSAAILGQLQQQHQYSQHQQQPYLNQQQQYMQQLQGGGVGGGLGGSGAQLQGTSQGGVAQNNAQQQAQAQAQQQQYMMQQMFTQQQQYAAQQAAAVQYPAVASGFTNYGNANTQQQQFSNQQVTAGGFGVPGGGSVAVGGGSASSFGLGASSTGATWREYTK